MAEQVDLIYAEFSTVAAKIGARSGPRSGRLDYVGRQLDNWVALGLVAPGNLPTSVVRFAECVVDFCIKSDLKEDRLCAAVKSELSARGFNRSLTLFQFVIGVAARKFAGRVAWERLDGHYLLITRELEDMFPEVSRIPAGARVSL